MKKFKLNMQSWNVSVMKPAPTEAEPYAMKREEITYPFRENLSGFLRAAGVFKTGEEIAEAVVLAKTIRDSEDTNDYLMLDEREADILKTALNRHIEATAENKTSLPFGGEVHEEAILRVFSMEEVQ